MEMRYGNQVQNWPYIRLARGTCFRLGDDSDREAQVFVQEYCIEV